MAKLALRTFSVLTENIEYADTLPYSLFEKQISGREVTPLYQWPTLELFLLLNMTEILLYVPQSPNVMWNQVFLIPPNIVQNSDLTCVKTRKLSPSFPWRK